MNEILVLLLIPQGSRDVKAATGKRVCMSQFCWHTPNLSCAQVETIDYNFCYILSPSHTNHCL